MVLLANEYLYIHLLIVQWIVDNLSMLYFEPIVCCGIASVLGHAIDCTQVVIHCIRDTVHNIWCSFCFIVQLASSWTEDWIDVQKAKGFVQTRCPVMDNKRYTVEQVADFMYQPQTHLPHCFHDHWADTVRNSFGISLLEPSAVR